jgi:enoyl-CoA hydratase/carnithine racemase
LAVVSDDVRLSLPFLKLGLVPEAGSTLLLPRRIGHARAFAWMASGDAMGAEEAHRLGLVNAVVDASAVTQTSEDMAAKLLRLSPSSLKHTKRLMRDPEALWQVVRAEGEIFRQQLQSPEAIAAFTAFLNR